MKGDGFLIVWHDMEKVGEEEFRRWHSREHMIERVSTPGFIAGRRGFARTDQCERWFTLYEGVDVEVFGSEPYRAKLNNPTPWTRKVQPFFHNVTRVGCEVVYRSSIGTSASIATIRMSADASADEVKRDLVSAAEEIADLTNVVGVTVGHSLPNITSAKTRESELRPSVDNVGFDWVLVAEGVEGTALETDIQKLETIVRRAKSVRFDRVDLYDLSHIIGHEEAATAYLDGQKS